jgi:hypothetical protein
MANFDADQPVPVSFFYTKGATEEGIPAFQPWPGGSGGAGSGAVFYMRAFDTTLNQVVFWTASFLDSTGTVYPGPGPLVRIVLIERAC